MDFSWPDILVAISLLFLGILMVTLFSRYLQSNSPVLFLGGLFAPSLIYLAIIGNLLEFRGLGFEAKFHRAAVQQIEIPDGVKGVDPSASSSTNIRQKSTVWAIFGIGSPVVFVTAPEKERTISVEDVYATAMKIYPGLLDGTFELLVVLDEWDRPFGYFPKSFFADLLRIELTHVKRSNTRPSNWDERLKAELEQTLLWDILASPRARASDWGITKTARLSDSNHEALSVMVSNGLDTIVVVDEDGKYAGILRRNDIISKLVVFLLGSFEITE